MASNLLTGLKTTVYLFGSFDLWKWLVRSKTDMGHSWRVFSIVLQSTQEIMGTISEPHPVKMIAALLSADMGAMSRARDELIRLFGTIDSESVLYPFTFSSYYDHEMGEYLHKQFISFETLVDPATIAAAKCNTNILEQTLRKAVQGADGSLSGRIVNIDPGYLNDAKLVLATTKDFSHRIYLGQGIYAEITLEYRKGGYRSHPWTYPDYQTDLAMSYFESVRNLYMEQR